MSDWIAQYTAALAERDVREQAHATYINAYTKLADRTSTNPTPAQPPTGTQPQPQTSSQPSSPNPASQPDLQSLRTDLASTQRARTTLTTTLQTTTSTLSTLRTTHSALLATHAALQSQKTLLERKLGDRDDEIRLKDKSISDVQDEMVALELQLNMAEQRAVKAEGENKELVARWIARKEGEVEEVNRVSRWE